MCAVESGQLTCSFADIPSLPSLYFTWTAKQIPYPNSYGCDIYIYTNVITIMLYIVNIVTLH